MKLSVNKMEDNRLKDEWFPSMTDCAILESAHPYLSVHVVNNEINYLVHYWVVKLINLFLNNCILKK